ncbi:MAG: hypothetical protein CVT85_04565 [Alphaproteobacteria bacterium HGW-Alphaproteobacteria-7]|jgi:hypothetical protein|nr:MAG: hypothetical protein CVT85_04565 [Alphaproteobacteria bacterium HGW-Alphaproteobacteria-7]
MIELIKQIEAIPANNPGLPDGLSDAAESLNSQAVWARIENYIAHRFTPREVVWTLDGCGDWTVPLTPATITASERWNGEAWEAFTLPVGPYGYSLGAEGQYRITADVGGGTVPPAILEAYRRLAEYLADVPDRAGVSQYSVNMGGAINESYSRSAAWIARAIENSGAADLLRPYRRA